MAWRSVSGERFRDWDCVAKRFWEAFSGMGLRGVSSDCESVKRTLMDRELVGTVLEPCWLGRYWNRR
jgi:hypothetical protein